MSDDTALPGAYQYNQQSRRRPALLHPGELSRILIWKAAECDQLDHTTGRRGHPQMYRAVAGRSF